ncbi:MAG: YceI family protein [Pseudomonadota bacterium]
MRFPKIAAIAAIAALIAAPLSAAPWKVDKSHAHVTFSVSHLGFSTTQGQFREFDAEIDFDPDNIEAATVSLTINAESIDTNWPARDKHVKSKDFLHVSEHPEITFVSRTVRLTGENTAEVTGDLTIRGVTHEEVFQAKLERIGPSPFNPDQQVAGFVIEGEVDRTKYDMTYGAPAIGTVIPLRVDVEISPAS